MSTTAIIVLAVVALLAWCALLDAVKESLAIRAKASACPCRDIHSLTLTPGATFEIPPGTVLSAGANADLRVVSYTDAPIDLAAAHPEFAQMRPENGVPADLQADVEKALDEASLETVDAYEDTRDAIDLKKAKLMMASEGDEFRRLRGESLLIKVLHRRVARGAPAQVG